METAFLENSKTALESFKKIGMKNLDVDHYEIYKCAKNKFETLRILASVKKDKSAKNSKSESIHCSLYSDPCICHFC
jgi:hypothetical protein